MKRRVWVTGADGFIGRHLLAHLLQQSDLQIGALGFRNPTLPSPANYDGAVVWQEGEVDHALLGALADRIGEPEIVYHLAGGGAVGASFDDPWFDFRCTVLSTAAVTDWLRQHAPAARLVQISSAAVYGGGHDGPIAEYAALDPYSPYGAHKLVAETLCRSARANYGLDTWVVRPFSVYGPGLRKQLLWDICSRMAAGVTELPLGGTGEERRDWLHVADLCDLLWRLSEISPNAGTVLNAGTGLVTTVRDIARQVAIAFGRPALPILFSGKGRPGDPFNLVADTTLLKQIGFHADFKVADGISEYVRWFTAQ